MNQIAGTPVVKHKKKGSVLKVIGITLLIILLFPIVLLGLTYLYLNVADFQYDDPSQVISQSTPMSFSQRNFFDAASRTQTMRLDNADFYYLAYDKIPELKYNESIYVNAYRVALEDSAIYLQGKAFGINIPVKLGVDIIKKNDSIFVKLTDASLGRWNIPVPLKLISEKAELELEYELDLHGIPFFGDAKNIYIKDGYLQLEIPIDKNYVKEGLNAWHYLKPASLYMPEENELVKLVMDYQKNWSEDGYISEHLDSLIKEFQQNPDKYQEFKVTLLACGPQKSAEAYFSPEKYDEHIMSRFYPGITPEAVEQMRGTLNFERNYMFLKKFAEDVDSQFGQNIITVRNGRFIDKKSGKALDWSSFFENAPEVQEVFPEGAELLAILTLGADSKQKIGRLKYSCGTAVKYPNGRCAVICQYRGNIYMPEITPNEYEDLATGAAECYIVQMVD